MAAVEEAARAHGRSLLTLDTAGAAAEALYTAIGYRAAGIIPGYALDATGGRLEDTQIMYKHLAGN